MPQPRILTLNGGSSSIKFSIFTLEGEAELRAEIARIGSPSAALQVNREAPAAFEAADHGAAIDAVLRWLEGRYPGLELAGVGHRIVHGGLKLIAHQAIDETVLQELKATQDLDLAHLPREIALIEACRARYPSVPQVACFDSAFFKDLPPVARLLPIPRRFLDMGVRRLGFHGLSYTYLMGELERIGVAKGRVVLMHLGAGASAAAVLDGRPIDTSMAFTPAAGLMMGARPGDLDPGLLVYLMRTERMDCRTADDFLNSQCGLAGLSGGISDMQALLAREDLHAREAVEVFCYQARKFAGAYAAALGGLDTLVFSGGIGEHSAPIRASICGGLEFLGVSLDEGNNAASTPVISKPTASTTVRVIPTDEEQVIANIVSTFITGL